MADSNLRPIAFLSDYGLDDSFAGVCRAVIARVNPAIRVIDLTHTIDPTDVRRGAAALADAVPYLPADSVVLAVVDPGVGTLRGAVAVQTADGPTLVGPDNGLLWLAAERLGGVTVLVDVSESPFALEPRSNTFHGRDVFAPVAAQIAAGARLDAVGAPAAQQLAPLDLPEAVVGDGRIEASVLDVDHFGNVRLCAGAELLSEIGAAPGTPVEVEAAGLRIPATRGATFGDVQKGEIVVYEDSSGALAIAVNGGSAAHDLNVRADDRVRVIGG